MPKSATASGGNAMIASTLVMRMFQVNTGIRNMVMPGARMQTIVVMKLTDPRIVAKPVIARPRMPRSVPRPGV
jgi:hypothetical protein